MQLLIGRRGDLSTLALGYDFVRDPDGRNRASTSLLYGLQQPTICAGTGAGIEGCDTINHQGAFRLAPAGMEHNDIPYIQKKFDMAVKCTYNLNYEN